ncbi:amidase signature domain-containing protein [Crucibulum laeve]|uniref:Amidase signature domain-containing protein n=1 Tax=Crucibulum laeve TaxID=68775 RepID=A0A5C3M5G4_9AGAR|nr:amidase signature domain-containing protein [Crucibulum laeve]
MYLDSPRPKVKSTLQNSPISAATFPSGWSGRGGQATNAYFPNADLCGSSSGSGIAASTGLAAVILGTETHGSISCPTSNNNLAGIKPMLGLTSRAGVIPISSHQDTIGPMTRSYRRGDCALHHRRGSTSVYRDVFSNDGITCNEPSVGLAFEQALNVIRSLGAAVVDPADLPGADEIVASNNETVVLDADFKIELNAWYEGLKNTSGVRSLADLIKFNDANPPLEEPTEFRDQFGGVTPSTATTGGDATFFESLAFNHELGRDRGIDAALNPHKLDALVLPYIGFTPTAPAAIAGYPIITGTPLPFPNMLLTNRLAVPLGFYPANITIGTAGPQTVYPAPGVPFNLSFRGTAFSVFDLISFGFAYEQKTKTRLARKAFAAATPKTQLKDVVGCWCSLKMHNIKLRDQLPTWRKVMPK